MGIIDPTLVVTGDGDQAGADPVAPREEDPNARLAPVDAEAFEAAKKGDVSALRKAFNNGARPNVIDGTGRLAINYAIEQGNKAVIKMFIEHGTDIARAAKIIHDLAPKPEAEPEVEPETPRERRPRSFTAEEAKKIHGTNSSGPR